MRTRPSSHHARPREPVFYTSLRAMDALPVEIDLITALQRINEAIVATSDLDGLLQRICEEVGRILRADRVHLALKGGVDGAFGRIAYEYISGAEVPATMGGVLPTEEEDEVMMDLIATPPPLAVVAPLENPKLPAGPRRVYELMRVQSAMAGRLQFQGKILGVLCVHQCDHVRHWSQQEATFLSVVLSQLSMAIANARMIRSMQAQHQELVSLHFKLEESHAGLERQVVERTAQLTQANAELQHMVDELKQVDKLKSAFLDTISHELRTPINFITGFGSLLADGAYGDLPPDGQHAVERILAGADRLVHLVDDLLDQSKMERGHLRIKPQVFDYVELIARVREEFAPIVAAKNQTLDVSCDDILPDMEADPDRVHQVLRNLLSNACKFTPERGRIEIRIRYDADHLVTEVVDNGIGIPPEAFGRIFDRFYQVDHARTRSYGGTGLGLAIVKGLLEAMSGDITVKSVLGAGSVFRFALPAARELKKEIPWNGTP